jgi:hypothetical protein
MASPGRGYMHGMIKAAILSGNVEIVKFLMSIGARPPPNAHGLSESLEVTKMLIANDMPINAVPRFNNIVNNISLGLLRYNHEECGQELIDDVFNNALYSNNIDCIKYIISRINDSIPQKTLFRGMYVNTIDLVLMSGDYIEGQPMKMQCVKYLYSVGLRWDNSTIMTAIYYLCVWDIIQFIIDMSSSIEYTSLKEAAVCNNVRAIEYLHKCTNIALTTDLYKCVENKHDCSMNYDLLYYLMLNNVPVHNKIYYYVFRSSTRMPGLKQVFEYLYKNNIFMTRVIAAKIINYEHPEYICYYEDDSGSISNERVRQYINTLDIKN